MKCLCSGISAHPFCPVDHLLDDERRTNEIAERAADLQKDTEWLFGAADQVLYKPEAWRAYLAGDDLAFMRYLRAEIAEQAKAEAADQVNSEERRRAA